MDQSSYFNPQASRTIGLHFPKTAVIGTLLIIALIAFEIFNFDTTRYALRNLLGDVSFLGLRWATILAIAFCSIDFAGLARLFTPERGREEPKAVWYLMGAWMLGATMNALMTWWAVSLTLLTHDFGNEVMSRQQLLQIVPVFVAALVWLTRILFIGAFSVAGDYIFTNETTAKETTRPALPLGMPVREQKETVRREPADTAVPLPTPPASQPRIRQSPPIPPVHRSPAPISMQARSRRR